MKVKYISLIGILLTLSVWAYQGEPKKNVDGCIAAAFDVMKIPRNLQSSPQLFSHILSEDMGLHELDGLPFLSNQTKDSYDLTPFIQQIAIGLSQHQQIVEFSCRALEEGLLRAVPSDMIVRMIHHIALLESLVREMIKDSHRMILLREQILKNRKELGVRNGASSVADLYKITGNLFEVVKLKTMDLVFEDYVRIRKSGELSPRDLLNRQRSLTVNILEAVYTENRNDFKDNALAGIALAINPLDDLYLDGLDNAIVYKVNQDWVNLYQSWNLAFVTGNINNLHLVYPKLLIPTVLSATPNEYIFSRALALWPTVNFLVHVKSKGRQELSFPEQRRLGQLWGEINRTYAEQYVRRYNGKDLTSYTDILGVGLRQLKSYIFGKAVPVNQKRLEGH